MLTPQSNHYRSIHDLSGLWAFAFDPDQTGITESWFNGLPASRPIAVPGSWNDQFESGRDYLGIAWYETRFELPAEWFEQPVFLRFNSVNYLAEVWLNGQRLGTHEGGHLPFVFDVTKIIQPGMNHLVTRVDGNLAPDRVPPGNVPHDGRDAFNHPYPDGNFDFFPYCGIHRPVVLLRLPIDHIDDLTIQTDLQDSTGLVRILVKTNSTDEMVRLNISGYGFQASILSTPNNWTQIQIPDAKLWEPGHPHLYELQAEVVVDERVVDSYRLPIGIRTVRVEGDQILLNGQPILLRGFGRHEDFPINGRGQNHAVAIKDLALIQWTGANSFRTAHYPCDEDTLTLADQLGLLVISETPAVGLFFADTGLDRRAELCSQMLTELIERDKNHPGVVMWSIANEPHSNRPAAESFLSSLVLQAKQLDPSRPVTYTTYVGVNDSGLKAADIVSLNRYYGWYTEHGRLEDACQNLLTEVHELHERFGKPVLLTEFGADAMSGHHAEPPEMFSEEYQAALIKGYLDTLEPLPFVAGYHVWVLCDFKTSQIVHRFGSFNLKGVFTRDRRPKLAARQLRERWMNTSS